MRLLSGLGNPDLCHELDSDPLGTVEVGEGWTEERREALGAVGRWSKMSRLIIDSNCVLCIMLYFMEDVTLFYRYHAKQKF